MKLHQNKPLCYALGVLLLMGLYSALLMATCHIKFNHFGYNDFDLAIHTQSLDAILRGNGESSILGIPFLGNHMVLILYIIAPLYLIFPSATLLLYVQTLVLAAGAWAIFRLAKLELSPGWGFVLAAAYLIYPPLIYLNLYEFHPIALASTFILYALLYWKQNAFLPFLLMLLLAGSCQENISLMAIGFGVFAIVERKRWWWIVTPVILGAAYFAIVVLSVMPHLNDTVNFQTLYAHLGNSMPEIAFTILRHPLKTLQLITEPAKLSFLKELFAPLGFLPLLSPLTWIPAGLILAQRLLSNRPTETVTIFHYQAEFIPFVFVSTIYAIRRLQALPIRILNVMPKILAIGFPILAAIAGGVIPLTCHYWAPPAAGLPLIKAKQTIVKSIPETARIAATFEFLAPLSGHDALYSLHHISSGTYTLSTKPYPTPKTLDTILLDTNDRLTFSPNGFYQPTTYLRLQGLLKTGHWKLLAHAESMLALQRVEAQDPRLPLAQQVAAIPKTASTNIFQEANTGFVLRAFEGYAESNTSFSVIHLYWETSATGPPDADMLLSIQEAKATVYETILSPGSRFWPPQSWPSNAIIRDEHRIATSQLSTTASLSVKMLPMTRQRGL